MELYGFSIWRRGSSSGSTAYVYSDASSDFHRKISCIAAVIRSDIASMQLVRETVFSNNIAVCEAAAVVAALEMCYSANIRKVVLHIDCETLFKSLCNPSGKEPEELRNTVKEIRRKCRNFSDVNVVIVSRVIVEEAHRLAIEKLRNTDEIR